MKTLTLGKTFQLSEMRQKNASWPIYDLSASKPSRPVFNPRLRALVALKARIRNTSIRSSFKRYVRYGD
jgi:hypothetical protein